jgi:carbonic anhydrase/acetyltransferase-like protein (isoleucine patch superfamily)
MAQTVEPLMVKLGAAVRECGQNFDRLGSFLQGRYGHLEKLQRTRRINHFNNAMPQGYQGAKFIAPSANLIGDVTLDEGCSVWYNAVIRGDRGKVMIGKNCHVLDRAVIRCGILSVRDVKIGNDVVIDSGAVVAPCQIADGAYIGANAVLLEGCKIGPGVVISPGAVVPEFAELLKPGVYGGVPAREGESTILSKEESEALATKKLNLAELAVDHERMNTTTIEQLTHERVVLKDMLETRLNDPNEFHIRPTHVNRAPNVTPTGNVEGGLTF